MLMLHPQGELGAVRLSCVLKRAQKPAVSHLHGLPTASTLNGGHGYEFFVAVVRWSLLLWIVELAVAISSADAKSTAFDEKRDEGTRLLREGQLQLAADSFEAAFRLRAATDVALQLGRIYLRLQNIDRARHYCKLYFESGPSRLDDRLKATECERLASETARRPGDEAAAISLSRGGGTARPRKHSPSVNPAVGSRAGGIARGREPRREPRAAPTKTDLHAVAQATADPATVVESRLGGATTLGIPLELVSLTQSDVTLRTHPIPRDQLELHADAVPQDPPAPIRPDAANVSKVTPIHKQWWLWTLAGTGVAASVAGAVVGLMNRNSSPASPSKTGTSDPLEGVSPGDVIPVRFPTSKSLLSVQW